MRISTQVPESGFLNPILLEKRNLSIATLMEETRPVVEKYEFQKGDISKLTGLLAFLEYQDSDARNKITLLKIE